MTSLQFEYAVGDRLQKKHYLEPVFYGAHDMTRLLREYDEQLFLVWNNKRKQYEVHSLGNRGSTFACDVPGNRLNSGVIDMIRRGDLRLRGYAVFDEVDRHNERIEAEAELRQQDFYQDLSESVADKLSKNYPKAGG